MGDFICMVDASTVAIIAVVTAFTLPTVANCNTFAEMAGEYEGERR
jgi:hypothetical protein